NNLVILSFFDIRHINICFSERLINNAHIQKDNRHINICFSVIMLLIFNNV
ncbi:hypothetical protein ACJX0J_014627, partial [Zea mays]